MFDICKVVVFGVVIAILGISHSTFAREEMTPNQKRIILERVNRNQQFKLYSQMLENSGWSPGELSIVKLEAGRCQQNICTVDFEISRSYTKNSQSVKISLGIGMWEDLRHVYMWNYKHENEKAFRQDYSPHVFFGEGSTMGGSVGTNIARSLILYFWENERSYIQDSFDYSNDQLYIALPLVSCIGETGVGIKYPKAECTMTTLDGRQILLDAVPSSEIYLSLAMEPMAYPDLPRDLLIEKLDSGKVRITMFNVFCEMRLPNSPSVGGNCTHFKPKALGVD